MTTWSTGDTPTVLAALSAALAVALLLPARARLSRDPATPPVTGATSPEGAVRRDGRRLLWALLAGVGAFLFVGGSAGLAAGVVTAGLAWWWLGTVEPAELRRARARAAHDLPTLVGLLAAGLRAGAAAPASLRLACQALPGPAADRLAPLAQRLALGADESEVWRAVSDDEALAPLGRTLSRAHETGAPVLESVDRLADELDAELRASAETRARTVGVKAALPLGLCLLPAFLLLGIVPLAAGLLGQVTG